MEKTLILRVFSICSVLTDLQSSGAAEHHVHDSDVSYCSNDPLPCRAARAETYYEGTGPDDQLTEIVRTTDKPVHSSTTVVTYEVVITADNPYLKLKPRLTANATIYTLTKDNVLTVPNKALRFTPNKDIVGGRKINDCQSSHKVWTLDNNTFTAHPVKIGITDGSKTEIVSGITENTPVVTETVVKGAMPGVEEPSAGEGERSPFMPGPPGSNKKKNK